MINFIIMKTISKFTATLFFLLLLLVTTLPACKKEPCNKPGCQQLGTSPENSKNTNFKINSASMKGDCIKLEVSYSGCTADRRKFALIWDGTITKSNPSAARLKLVDEAPPEMCEAYFTKTLFFDVKKIKTNFRQQTVMLMVEDYPTPVKY
jgi:hypothetical protein